eukprot:2000892-Amphidinium_carterae.1
MEVVDCLTELVLTVMFSPTVDVDCDVVDADVAFPASGGCDFACGSCTSSCGWHLHSANSPCGLKSWMTQ